MKKYVILTSVLALAACGGGSGSGGGAIIGGGDTGITDAGKDLTSLPVAIDNRSEIVAYVESKLGPDYYDVSGSTAAGTNARAATARAKVLTLDEKYAQARAKLDAMNDTLSQMLKNNTTIVNFIEENKDRVIEALKLFGINIGTDTDPSVDDMKNAFDENVSKDELDKFNESQSLQTQKIDDIDFLSAVWDENGQDMLKITTKDGKISGMAIVGLGEYDENIKFARVGNTEKFVSPKLYGYRLPNMSELSQGMIDEIEFDVTEDLSLDDLKAEFAARAEKICKGMSCPDEVLDGILARIDELTAADRNATDSTGRNTGFIATNTTLTMDVHMQGAALGMRYADFGYANIKVDSEMDDKSGTEDSFEAYAGGYDLKRVAPEKMSGENVFKGRAVGGVAYELITENDENNTWDYKPLSTDDAKLTFNNGKETLNMNFGDNGWYNVTVVSEQGKSSVEFAGVSADKNFALDTKEISDIANTGNDELHGKFRTDYYGDDGIASEATAILGVTEYTKDDRWVEFGAAFGGVKKDK